MSVGAIFFLHGGIQRLTFASYALPWLTPFCQTAPLLPSVTWQQNRMEYGGKVQLLLPHHQNPITCCCCVTDGSRGAVWQNAVWHGTGYEAKTRHWIPPCRNSGTHQYSSMITACLWRPNSGCEHSAMVGGAFQQWQLWQWVSFTGTDFYKHSMQAPVHL